MSLLHARYAWNKVDVITGRILDTEIDIMFLTETWLINDIGDITDTGYSVPHTSRVRGTRGGGVAVIHGQNIIVGLMKPPRATFLENTWTSK